MANGDDDGDDHFYFRRESNYDLNSRIMLAAIVSLSVVVVIVTILHVYARCVLRSQTRRRRAARREMDFIISHSVAEPPRRTTGLDASVIASLPLFVFKKQEDDHHHDVEATNTNNNSKMELLLIECSICLSTSEDGEVGKVLPNCKHSFHAECIDMWLRSHSTCPVCRTEAEPRPGLRPLPTLQEGTAPPVERAGSNPAPSVGEGIFNEGEAMNSSTAGKVGGSSSSSGRLSSFRRMLSREKSSRQLQTCGGSDENGTVVDIERQ